MKNTWTMNVYENYRYVIRHCWNNEKNCDIYIGTSFTKMASTRPSFDANGLKKYKIRVNSICLVSYFYAINATIAHFFFLSFPPFSFHFQRDQEEHFIPRLLIRKTQRKFWKCFIRRFKSSYTNELFCFENLIWKILVLISLINSIYICIYIYMPVRARAHA